MPDDVPKISDAEWEVLRVIWEREPVTARGVLSEIPPERDWSEPTVKTLINRLVKKGVLEFEIDGRRYLYRAKLGRDEVVRQESRSFVDRVFGGSARPLVAHFLEEGEFDADEIAELRRLLDEKEAE